MRVVSFKVDEDLLELVEEFARRRRITRSELIRRALRDYISMQRPRFYITRRIKVF